MTSPADELYSQLDEFLRRVFALTESHSVERLLEYDVTFPQARTLFVLAHVHAPMPIGDVARRLGMSQAAAGRNVDQLVQQGLVEREESPEDRRVKLVRLSDRGLELAAAHHADKRQALRLVTERLSAAECARLSAALEPILSGDHLRTSTHPCTEEHTHGLH